MRRLLLLSYVALISALMISDGLYNRMALLFVAASFGLLLAAAYRFYRRDLMGSDRPLDVVLLVALLFSLGFWFVKPTSTDLHPTWYEQMAMGAAGLAILGVLGWYLFGRWPLLRRAIFIAIAILPVVLWFLLPQALPRPPVDVYAFHQGAAARLLDGVNPYSVQLGTLTYFNEPSGYQYPPGILYPVTLSVWLTGEVRYGQAVFMVATAFLLWLVARRGLGNASAELLTLIFLYHPRGIFVLDHSFTETFLIAPLALFVFLMSYKRLLMLAALAYGYFVSLKSYLVFLLLPWLIVEKRPRYLVLGVIGAIVPILPFLSADFIGTVRNGFLFVILFGPFRPDSLTVTSLLFEMCGCRFSVVGWSLFVGGLGATLTFWLFRQRASLASCLYAITIIMFSIFFLGSQAFGGYYYLITVMLLLLITVVKPGVV